MTRKRSQKVARRANRQAKSVSDKRRANWVDVNTGDTFGVIGRAPMWIAFKIVRRGTSPRGTTYRFKRLEDTIHPFSLSWPVPLIDNATNGKDFARHWEKINYVFNLPRPSDIPKLQLSQSDRQVAERFVVTCRVLASYSVFNGNGGTFSIKKDEGRNEYYIETDLPSHEVFSGLSVTFRQIHNDGDEASFKKVAGIIRKSIESLNNEERKLSARDILKSWDSARSKMVKEMLETLVCAKVLDGVDRKGQNITMEGINPGELITYFNYGDTLHWGKHRERLKILTDDPSNDHWYRFCVIAAMINLSHFYFGFAELVTAALISSE